MQEPAEQISDTRALRAVLGAFPTGVAIITVLAEGAQPVGVTVNSLSSVSLDPPLLLWSLLSTSPSMSAFRGASHYCVNILAADQAHVATRFASKIPDKFDGIQWRPGPFGTPVLSGCSATLLCETAFQNYGGDHTIFIGRIMAFEQAERQSLLFVRGQFSAA